MCQGDPATSSEVDGEPGEEAINTQSGVKVPREISHRSRAWQKGRLSRRKVVGGERAGQEKLQAASSFAHDCFFFSGKKQGRGGGEVWVLDREGSPQGYGTLNWERGRSLLGRGSHLSP